MIFLKLIKTIEDLDTIDPFKFLGIPEFHLDINN